MIVALATSAFLALAPAGETGLRVETACRPGTSPIADERGGGRKLCITDRERARAKTICGKLGEKNWLQCTCQDGSSVGACRD